MRMGYGLWQEQTQKLVMTPELRQAITVLQYSSQELLEYLEEEVAHNPVMELEAPEWLQIAKELRDNRQRSNSRDQHKEFPVESVVRANQSLEEYLNRQLSLVKASPKERQLAAFIIGNLDSNGYLTMKLEEVAEIRGCTRDEAETALRLVQSLEPTGVGARSLEECLLLQALEIRGISPVVLDIIEHHLADVAQGRIGKIASALGVTPKETQQAIDLIRTLDPKPGRWYTHEPPTYISPDVIVERVSGEYVVVVNDQALPRLHINDFYRKVLEQKEDGISRETKEYISGKLNSALWLLRSIEQRRQTLFKVTEAIVDLQKEFLDHGVRKLRPLTLKQVADRIGMHESTVSRATSGKYVQTPRGVFELKYFFTSGVSTEAGDGASAESIKAKIRALVEREDSAQPLSDQKICELLQEEGVRISRRTVAKYREEAGIASSMQRKRY
ncbi:RNA polymerase factor sigma-54 [Effusibacillus lacus]|uniref:RNA polymerase sigma-54 factor n=1 Tax=Effusibacillus lacus TaxID=1348429 RepID=A0A292YPD8_9BACL|nr:RNA polymerase factor sigma-54 [Effusibacillus lacus]TCS74224.1 RNA polymerase RpoN-/SigL-like sigma 54 subunit [Effusibacillus lacus]GAX90779.1 RNA polymerase sigma-54 factor [Effusibacillus lacus]